MKLTVNSLGGYFLSGTPKEIEFAIKQIKLSYHAWQRRIVDDWDENTNSAECSACGIKIFNKDEAIEHCINHQTEFYNLLRAFKQHEWID